MYRKPVFGYLWTYFAIFSQKEWGEKKQAPFDIRQTARGFELKPRDAVKKNLDNIIDSNFLKKRLDGTYVAENNNNAWITKMFQWFVYRAWRVDDYGVLWSIIHEYLQSGGTEQVSFSAKQISSLTDYGLNRCEEQLKKFLKDGYLTKRGDSYSVKSNDLDKLFSKYRTQLPNWTEERIMEILCSMAEIYTKDVCREMAWYSLQDNTTYKAVKKLRKEKYIRVTKSDRPEHSRGPLREYLGPNCDNCFWGHSSKDRCMEYAFGILTKQLEEISGRKIESEEKIEFKKALKEVPNNLQLLHRLNGLLYRLYLVKENIKSEDQYFLGVMKRIGLLNHEPQFLTLRIPFEQSGSVGTSSA